MPAKRVEQKEYQASPQLSHCCVSDATEGKMQCIKSCDTPRYIKTLPLICVAFKMNWYSIWQRTCVAP